MTYLHLSEGFFVYLLIYITKRHPCIPEGLGCKADAVIKYHVSNRGELILLLIILFFYFTILLPLPEINVYSLCRVRHIIIHIHIHRLPGQLSVGILVPTGIELATHTSIHQTCCRSRRVLFPLLLNKGIENLISCGHHSGAGDAAIVSVGP